MTREHLAEKKRYILSLLLIGAGTGVATEIVFALVPLGLWYLLWGKISIKNLLSDRSVLLGICGSILLVALPFVLYPHGAGFVGSITLLSGKSVVGVLMSPFSALSSYLISEPIMMGLFIIGLGILWVKDRRLFLFTVGYFYIYAIIFYICFRFEARFMLPLIPVAALIAGYAVDVFLARYKQWFAVAAVFVLFCIPLAAAARLSVLAAENDTRIAARTWTLEHLAPTDKILLYADLTRLPTTPAAVQELQTIDPTAVRKTDEADATLNTPGNPYALNLYNVNNETFFENLPAYAKAHGYTYLLYQPGYEAGDAVRIQAFAALIAHADVTAQLIGLPGESTTDSTFTSPPTALFAGQPLGPTIVIYKLK